MMRFVMLFNSIKNHKNRFKGEDIYILANGPSIKDEDLSVLKSRVSIGINASPLLEKKFGFESQYYTVSDTRFITHPEKYKMATDMLGAKAVRVFREELKPFDSKEFKNRTFYVESLGKDGFSSDLSKGFYFGASTTMLAVQLAAYLGASKIYLLGVDLKYDGESPRFYSEEDVQEYDHFTSTQIKNIRNSYLKLKKNGVKLFNCSKSSLLRSYIPYIDFNNHLKKEES